MKVKISLKTGPKTRYELWQNLNRLTSVRRDYLKQAIAETNQPLLTVVMPAQAPNTLASIHNQCYNNWQLCDFNKLQPYKSTGYLCFVEPGDELEPHAFAELVLAIHQHHPDILYSDEDQFDGNTYYNPFFKPDWSPELLLSFNYLNHLTAIKAELFYAVKSTNLWDLYLKASEKTNSIYHIPKILYHQKAQSLVDKTVLTSTLQRRNTGAQPYHPEWAKDVNILYHSFPDQGPAVTIIIAATDQELLTACLQSIKQKTTYENYQIVIDKPFNVPYQTISNYGQINTPYILFLDDDTEVSEPKWLSNMMGYMQFSGVGAVGARLIFDDFRIQHAGIIHDTDMLPKYAFELLDIGNNGYQQLPWATRNCSSVSAACLLTSRKLFNEIGPFDKEKFSTYYDVDYCYKLLKSGYRTVYCSSALLLHHNKHPVTVEAVENYKKTYRTFKDPYYNPNLEQNYQVLPRCISYDNMKPIQSIIYSHNLKQEDAQLTMKDIIINLKKQNIINPTIITPEGGPLVDTFKEQDIPVIIDETFADPSKEQELMEIMSTYDVLYANTILSFLAVQAAKYLKLPCLWNIYESDPTPELMNQGYMVDKKLVSNLSYPYRVIFGSQGTRQGYEMYNKKFNFTTVYNVIDVKTINKAQLNKAQLKDELIILSVGTIDEQKAQMDIIDALELLPLPIGKKIKCYLVGFKENSYGMRLMSKLKIKPDYLKKRIKVINETQNTDIYYAAADIFIYTPRITCFPRTIIKSMHYALPVIATNVFGITEQIKDTHNGFLVEPRDYQKIAYYIKELFLDKKLRNKMGNNNKEMLETLPSLQENINTYKDFFREAYL